MVPREGERCLGVAYRLLDEEAERVLDELDYRERAGFERRPVTLVREDGSALESFTYFAEAGNPHFLGPAPLPELVAQIAVRRGPSGSNRDYALELAAALRKLGAHDSHVFEVEAALLRLGD